MGKIIITTDSGMDPINEENMISALLIEDDNNTYKDVREITSKEILKKNNEGHIFKTASPVLEDYETMFKKYLNDNDIIHLSMSSGISEGSVNASRLMADSLNDEYENNVYVVDSYTGAVGGTLFLEYAKYLVENSSNKEELIDNLNELKTRVKTSFFVPNPEGFIRSGRNRLDMKNKLLIKGVEVSRKLNIKFRVDFNENGNLYVKSVLRTKNNKGFLKLVKDVVNEENKKIYDPKYVVVGTLNEVEVNMQEIIEYLNNLNYFENIIRKDINGVVAAYGCNDLCGISLVKKM